MQIEFKVKWNVFKCSLRGPAAIPKLSRDTCSDSIAENNFVLVSVGYYTTIARYVAKWGIVRLSSKGGPFWDTADLPEKVSRA